jgi:hypothetical protein
MPLKDYSTSKSPESTIAEIQTLLKNFGVQGIITDYDDSGNIVNMSFKLLIQDTTVVFRMPSDWRPVLKALKSDKRVPRHKCNEDQARRTAWRQIYHWIDAQLALVSVHMVKIETIFLPYVVTKSGETFSERFDNNSQLLLN